MIRVLIGGTHTPKKGSSERALWEKADPIRLLRKCLMNKLRSTHWRSAHRSKKDFMDAFKANAVVKGEPVKGRAMVVLGVCLAREADVDATIKSVLDAAQGIILESGDDKDIHALFVAKSKATKGGMDPHVVLAAQSIDEEPEACHAMLHEAMHSLRTTPDLEAA
jgi:hypothetical protein